MQGGHGGGGGGGGKGTRGVPGGRVSAAFQQKRLPYTGIPCNTHMMERDSSKAISRLFFLDRTGEGANHLLIVTDASIKSSRRDIFHSNHCRCVCRPPGFRGTSLEIRPRGCLILPPGVTAKTRLPGTYNIHSEDGRMGTRKTATRIFVSFFLAFSALPRALIEAPRMAWGGWVVGGNAYKSY